MKSRVKVFETMLLGLLLATTVSGVCEAQGIDDPFSDYLQRSVTISLGAGNAKDTNAAVHTINPWPRYVGDTHIHTTGRQAVDSIQRLYRVPNPFEREAGGGSGSSAGGIETGNGAAGGLPVTPVQPISGGY
jgi:hypothetical protein